MNSEPNPIERSLIEVLSGNDIEYFTGNELRFIREYTIRLVWKAMKNAIHDDAEIESAAIIVSAMARHETINSHKSALTEEEFDLLYMNLVELLEKVPGSTDDSKLYQEIKDSVALLRKYVMKWNSCLMTIAHAQRISTEFHSKLVLYQSFRNNKTLAEYTKINAPITDAKVYLTLPIRDVIQILEINYKFFQTFKDESVDSLYIAGTLREQYLKELEVFNDYLSKAQVLSIINAGEY